MWLASCNEGHLTDGVHRYDWYKGSQFYNKNEASRIFLHAVSELDIKPRGKKNTR